MSNFVDTTIHLEDQEAALFRVVLESLRDRGKDTVARVAGGWVRDKLLGKVSHDIDIALDDQSGVEFAHGMKQYLESVGKSVGTVGVVMVSIIPISINWRIQLNVMFQS